MKQRSDIVLVIITIILAGLGTGVNAQLSERLKVKGYLKELGQVSLNDRLGDIRYDNVIHHRVETEWIIGPDLQIEAHLRSRLLNGYTVENTPGLRSFFEQDPNPVDLTKVWTDSPKSLFYSEIDRLYASWYSGSLEVHAGRQRVNWARTFVWSPNDLFNNYAYLDFDYEERPGVDAISVIWNLDFASGIETAVRFGNSLEESVIAGMYRFNSSEYDLQILGGHYLDRLALGFGWAGYIRDSGFKGELSYFHPEEGLADTLGTFTISVGADHMFSNGIYAQAELLYNGGYENSDAALNTLVQPPRADDLFISDTGYFLNGSWQAGPLSAVGLGTLGSFTRSLFVLIPSYTLSLSQDIDMLLIAQLLRGAAFDLPGQNRNLIFLRLKWSY